MEITKFDKDWKVIVNIVSKWSWSIPKDMSIKDLEKAKFDSEWWIRVAI